MLPAMHRELKALRLKRGLSQTELAKRCGVLQPNLSTIERGVEGVTLETLEKILRALNARLRIVAR